MAGQNSAVTLGAINERRLRPVYDLLDNGNNKNAIHEADKILKKQKDLHAAKVLKTIALQRVGRGDEAFALSQEVIQLGPTDENSLQGLTLFYRETNRLHLIPSMYEMAVSKCPGNEEYLSHLFMAYVRAGKPKEMQRVALNLYKHHPKNPYLFWGVMSIMMQAHDNEKLGKAMFLPLAEKMIEKHIERGRMEADAETRLYLMVLHALGKYEKAMETLEGGCTKNNSFDAGTVQEMTTELNRKMGKWDKVNSLAKKLLQKNPDIWNYVLDYLDSLEHLVESGWKPEKTDEEETSLETPDYTWSSAIELLSSMKSRELAENSDRLRRGPFLAVLEFIHRMKKHTESTQQNGDRSLDKIVDLLIEYGELFCSKPCCFNDIERFIKELSENEKSELLKRVNFTVSMRFPNGEATCNGGTDDKQREKEILSHLFYMKMQRFLGYHEILSRGEKLDLVTDLLKRHTEGIKYSEYRPSTDLKAVDDYCLIAANVLVDMYREDGDPEMIWRAIYALELAKQSSESNFRFKFMLIRLYSCLGVFMPCANLYDSLEIKHIQQDTLGYLISNSVSALGHYQLASQAYEATRAYFISNEKDSLEFLISCFRNGTFHKIQEFIQFRDRVRNSIQNSMTLIEHTYMDFITQADKNMSLERLMESSVMSSEVTNIEKLTDNRDLSLRFDWTMPTRSITDEHIEASFCLEKKWLRFREMLVRSLIALLRATLKHDKEKTSEIPNLLEDLDKSIQEMESDPDLKVKFTFHGPPQPRSTVAIKIGFPSIVMKILRLFEKLLISGSECDDSWQDMSNSVISVIQDAVSSGEAVVGKQKEGYYFQGDHRDIVCSVKSETPTDSVMNIPVPNSLKEVKREGLEHIVLTSELFSIAVLLAYNFRTAISDLKSDGGKRRRKKKQGPPPKIIEHFAKFVVDLEEIGTRLKAVIKVMKTNASLMNLDRTKLTELNRGYMTPIEPAKDENASSDTPTSETNHKSSEDTYSDDPNAPWPIQDQLIQMVYGSHLNAVGQLRLVIDARLKNLKVMKM